MNVPVVGVSVVFPSEAQSTGTDGTMERYKQDPLLQKPSGDCHSGYLDPFGES